MTTTATTTTTTTDPAAFAQLDPAALAAFAQQFIKQTAESPDADPVLRAMMLRTQAIDHQGQASRLLAEADRLEHEAALRGEAERADAVLAAAEAEAAGLAEAVRAAVERERAAADRLADAAENARRAGDVVEELALAGADPAAQTDAIVRRDAARQVEMQFRAAAERATAERGQAELTIAQAREVIRQGRIRAKAARDLAERAAETVRPSVYTLTLDWQRLATGGQLTDEELAFVRTLVEGLAQVTGADKNLGAAAYRRAKEENREEFNRALALLPAPQAANLLPPGVVPGSAVAR